MSEQAARGEQPKQAAAGDQSDEIVVDESPFDPEKEIKRFAELVYYQADVVGTMKTESESMTKALVQLRADRDEIDKRYKKYVDEQHEINLRDLFTSLRCVLEDLSRDLGQERREKADRLIRKLKDEIDTARRDLSLVQGQLVEQKKKVVALQASLAQKKSDFKSECELSDRLKTRYTNLSKLANGIKGDTGKKAYFKAYVTAIEIIRQFNEGEVDAPPPADYLDRLTAKWVAIVSTQTKLAEAQEGEAELKGQVQKYTKIIDEDLAKDRIKVLLRRWQQEEKEEVVLAESTSSSYEEAPGSEEVPEWGTVTSL
jgi:hypothetical protein